MLWCIIHSSKQTCFLIHVTSAQTSCFILFKFEVIMGNWYWLKHYIFLFCISIFVVMKQFYIVFVLLKFLLKQIIILVFISKISSFNKLPCAIYSSSIYPMLLLDRQGLTKSWDYPWITQGYQCKALSLPSDHRICLSVCDALILTASHLIIMRNTMKTTEINRTWILSWII